MENIDLLNNNPKFIGKLTTSILNALPRANEGEIAFCTDTNEVKIYTDGAWAPMGNTGDLLKLNLYDSYLPYAFFVSSKDPLLTILLFFHIFYHKNIII